MGKSFVINILGIILISWILWWSFDFNKVTREEAAHIQLSEAIEKANRAAANELLSVRDTDIDYEDYNNVKSDPQAALDIFIDIFLKNMGMSLSEENKQMVQMSYMPTFVVALTDGFYIAKHTKVKDGQSPQYRMEFSPKLSYAYEFNNETYSLIQGAKYHYTIGAGGDVTRTPGLPPGISRETQVSEIIGRNITSAMKSTIDSYEEVDNAGWSGNFYLPAELTTNSRVNAIDGPTVITLLQGVDISTVEPIDTYSITGNKLNTARSVVTYVRDGIKYYSYHDKAPADMTIIQPYSSMYEAAINGYMADIQYME